MPVGPRATDGETPRTSPSARSKGARRKPPPRPELKKRVIPPVAPSEREPRVEPEPHGEAVPWYQRPVVAVAATVLFFPLGVVLVSQSRWPARTKAAVLGAGASVLAVLLVVVLLHNPGTPTMLNAGGISSTTLVSDAVETTTVPVDPTGSTVVDQPVVGADGEVPPSTDQVPVSTPGPTPTVTPSVPAPGGVTPTPTTIGRAGGNPTPSVPPSTNAAPPPTNNNTSQTTWPLGPCHKAYADAGTTGPCVPGFQHTIPGWDVDCVGHDDGIGVGPTVSGPISRTRNGGTLIQDVYLLDSNQDGVACGPGD
jgi:hypothetical protein